MKTEHTLEYQSIVDEFLGGGGEPVLYRASLLSRKLIEDELGPHDVMLLHFTLLDRVLSRTEPGEHRRVVSEMSLLLLEVMMVFSQAHQKVRAVLDELQEKYQELDQAKSELERSRDELQEKTAQLVQTEKMTALGELTAGVAHEINQPLNVIKIICEDVKRDIHRDRLDIEELREGLEDALGEVKRMAEIVDHMRVFTRRTEGSQRDRVDANALVKGVFKLLGQQLCVHGIAVEQELGEDLQILVDPVRMEQVVMNLIANARDALKENQPGRERKLSIRTFAELAESGGGIEQLVVIEIEDTGCGVPGEFLERIFDPFFTRKPVGEGTGLGLSVSREIVEDHGGRLSAISDVGVGSTFRIQLPAFPITASRPPLRDW